MQVGDDRSVVLFGLAVGITAVVAVLLRAAIWILRQAMVRRPPREPH